MEHNASFEAQKAELFELIKREPTASSNREGLTPLQIRLLNLKSLSTSELREEERLCADLYDLIPTLNDAQVDRFVKYILQSDFEGSYLHLRYNYFYMKNLRMSTSIDPIVIGLLVAMVLNLGKVKIDYNELLNDPVLTQLKTKDPDLWLELLYQTNWDLFEEDLVDRFEIYGYEVLALGRERWLAEGRCNMERLSNLVHRLSGMLEEVEKRWMMDFITEYKVK